MTDEAPGRKKGKGSKRAREPKPSRRPKKPDGRRRAKLISAIDHPLRRRILRVLHDSCERRSPTQIAKELDQSLGAVAYHVRVLAACCILQESDEREERGEVAHLYESAIENDPPIEALLEETREADGGNG